MSSFQRPLYISDVFNASLYGYDESNTLTIYNADRRYLKLTGGIVGGSVTFNANLTLNANLTYTGIVSGPAYSLNGTSILMSALTGITIGTGSASKALVLDASRNINNINVLTTSEFNIVSNIRLVTSGSVNYIQSGSSITGNSSQDIMIGNMLNTFNSSARVFMVKSNGRVGIQSYAPTKQLDINSSTGACMRLQYNSSTDGTGTNNVDFDVSASGSLTITPTGGNVTIPVTAGGDILTLSSSNTGARSTIKFVTDTQNWELGTRGSTAVNPNSLYIYNGSYKLIMNPAGDTQILSSTDSTSQSTGCLQLTGGLGVVKNIYTTGSLTVDRSGGSNLNIKNGANSAFLEVSSTNMLRLVAGGGTMAVNIDSNGVVIGNGTSTAKCRLDLGATASNMTLSLFNNTSSYYGFSANNNSLQYSAFGNHNWYSSCTNASPIQFNCMSLTSGGTLTTAENVVAGTGFWAKQGFNSTGRSGNGVAVVMGNSTYGEVYAYEYGPNVYKGLYVGNVMYVNDASDSVNINGGINAGLYPLTVNGSSSTTFSPYGYLSSGGAGSGGSSGVVPVSIWAQHRIACTEFNAYSDRRLKENIKDLSSDDAVNFVRDLNPKSYNWKSDKNNLSIGYIAQDILRLRKWDCLVSLSEDAELKEEIDDDKLVSPAGKRFQVSYQNAIPILHQALKHSLEQIEKLSEQVDELREFILNGEDFEEPQEPSQEIPKPVKRRIKKIIRRIII